MCRDLKNKPLAEAIFELRWELQDKAPSGEYIDAYYSMLIGALYTKVKEEYGFHEPLPTADIPDRFAPYTLQHRFRRGRNKWPLIQVGPGIITLNDTENYVWTDFKERIFKLVDIILEIHPNSANMEFNSIYLLYIDAIEFDYESSEVFKFLKEKMKTEINIYEGLFEDTGVITSPSVLDLRLSFPSTMPKGSINMRIAQGKKADKNSLILETAVISSGENTPKDKNGIAIWVDSAHNLTHDWFFKIIEGDLLKEFE